MAKKTFIGRLSASPSFRITGRRCLRGLRRRRNLSFLFLFFGIATLPVGCSSSAYLRNPVPNKPETRFFDMKPDIVFKGVERALAAKKFKVSTRQTGPYAIETEWLQDGSYRSMIQVQVKPAGKNGSEVTVHVHLQKKTMWQKSWQPVNEIGNRAYDDFMDDIQIESYRALYDRR